MPRTGKDDHGPGPDSGEGVIGPDDTGMRLDRWLRRRFPAQGQGEIQKLLRTGQIRLDGRRVEASARLEAGQIVRIPPFLRSPEGKPAKKAPPDDSAREAARLRALLLYEDDDVLVFNKPSGLAVQGGTGLRENLDSWLAALERADGTKPRLVHRLDRETSGVLLVARTERAARRLAEAFRDRATRKIYWAVTECSPPEEAGRLEWPLVRRGVRAEIARPDHPEAQDATTLYRVAARSGAGPAFVMARPLTGRTHQIRVHLAAAGAPILGDPLYGRAAEGVGSAPGLPKRPGLHLHARRLTLPHPRRGTLDVMAPLGKPMAKTFATLGFDPDADDEGCGF